MMRPRRDGGLLGTERHRRRPRLERKRPRPRPFSGRRRRGDPRYQPLRHQRIAQRMKHHRVHLMLAHEAHLCLSRVHVDIHQVRRQVNQKHHNRKAPVRQQARVSLVHRVRNGPAAHRTPVDKEELLGAIRPRPRGGREKRLQAHHRLRLHGHQFPRNLPPEHAHERGQVVSARVREALLRGVAHGEGYLRTRQRQPLHEVERAAHLRLGAFHELQPRGHVLEQPRHPNRRAVRRGRGRLLRHHAAPYKYPRPLARAARLARDLELRHRRDARQRLSPEAVRRDCRQVFGGANLGGGVALNGDIKLFGGHARAVVGNFDELPPAILERNGDARRTRVYRVLDKLLDHRGRPLDDLARRNLAGDLGRQDEDSAALSHTSPAPLSEAATGRSSPRRAS